MSKVRRLIFCDAFSGSLAGREDLVIAMNPEVYSRFKQAGARVHNTLPYFTNRSHEKALEKSKEALEWLRDNPNFAGLEMGDVNAYQDIFILWLRCAIHYCLWAAEVIQNATEAHRPEEIVVYSVAPKPSHDLCLEPEEGNLALLAEKIAGKNKVIFSKYLIRKANLTGSSLFRKVKDLKRLIIYAFRFKLLQWGMFVRARNDKPVVFTSRSYRMDKLAQRFQKEFPDKAFCFLKDPFIALINVPDLIFKLSSINNSSKAIMCLKKTLNNIADNIQNSSEIFTCRGISFGEMISKKLCANIINHIAALAWSSVALEKELDRLDPAMVVSNACRGDDLIIAELCRKQGIPCLLISHGSHVKPKNEYELIEWGEQGRQFFRGPFSIIAMPTPISGAYLEAFPSSAAVVKTGPLTWGMPASVKAGESLFRKFFGDKYVHGKAKVVVHTGTPKASNALRFFVHETSDEYIQALSELAETVEKIPDVLLVIKFRPSSEISVDILKSLVPFSEKVVLSVAEPLLDVLGMADLLVSFSSTAIDEALQNRIPVILYGGGGRYQHISACGSNGQPPLGLSAIYHVEKAADLGRALSEILGLDIKNKHSQVFDPYIYPKEQRISFSNIVARRQNNVDKKSF